MLAVISMVIATALVVGVSVTVRDCYWRNRIEETNKRIAQRDLIVARERRAQETEQMEERRQLVSHSAMLRQQRDEWQERARAAEEGLLAKVVFSEREVIPIHDMTPAEEEREHRRLAERMVTGIARTIAAKGIFESVPLDEGNAHSPKTTSLTVYLKDLL